MMSLCRLALVLLGLLFLTSPAVHATPQDDYLQIYLLIQDAEKLENAGQGASARAKYDTAYQRLNKLQKENKDWEPVIVKYRINYTKNKLDKLKEAKDANPTPDAPIVAQDQSQPAKAPVVDAPADNATRPPSPAQTVSATAPEKPVAIPLTNNSDAAINARIKQLESDLAETKKQLNTAVAENAELRARQQVLEKQIATLREGSSDAKFNDLLQEHKTTQLQLAKAQDELGKLKSGGASGMIVQLEEQLKKTQEQLSLAQKQNEAVEKANQEYKKQLEDIQGKLASAQQTISKLEPSEKENQMLRNIIERQLKEQARRDASRRLAMEELNNLKLESTQLRSQIEILSSPLVTLSDEELKLFKAPAPAGLTVDNSSGSISAPLPATSGGDYSTKPRIPDDSKQLADEAVQLFSGRKFDEAAAKYQAILNIHPDSLYALSNLGVVRFQQGNYPAAEKVLRQAVALAPQDAFSHSILGIVLYQEGKFDEAVTILTRAVALDPNDPKTRNYLGISASQKGWQEAAEQECRKAIELDPTYGDAHFNLAVIYATQRPPAVELARRHYNRAIELGVPRDPQLEKMFK